MAEELVPMADHKEDWVQIAPGCYIDEQRVGHVRINEILKHLRLDNTETNHLFMRGLVHAVADVYHAHDYIIESYEVQ